MKKIFIIGLISMLTLSVEAKYNGDYLRDITLNYKTDHLDWYSVVPSGKINSLFIIPRKGGREVVEVVQRMDMNFSAVTTLSAVKFVSENIYEGALTGTTLHEKKTELLKKLESKYDLFVIGNFDFDKMPAEAKFKILYQVMSGSGLVICYPRKTELKSVFAEKIPGAEGILSLVAKEGLPLKAEEQYDDNLLTTYMFGKGRIAVIDYKDNHNAIYEGLALTARNNYTRHWQAEFENNMVLILRAIKWATGYQSKIKITCPTLVDTVPLEQKSQIIKLDISSQQEGCSTVKLRIRDEFNKVIKNEAIEITGKNNIVDFKLPLLAAGKYYLDVIAGHDDMTDNAGYFSFTVKSPVSAEIIMDKESFRNHSPLNLELKMNGAGLGMELEVSLFDLPYNREWYRKKISINDSTNIDISIDNYYIPTIAGYIKCAIKQNGVTLSETEKTLFFPDYNLENYLQLAWDSVQGQYLAPIYAKKIVDELGWRTGLSHPKSGGTNARDAAMLNQRFVPYIVRIMLEKGDKGEVKQGNWFFIPKEKRAELESLNGDESFADPIVRQLWADGIKHRIVNLPKYGPALYNLGDENHFSYDAGFGKYDTKAFCDFMKQKYGSIAALNAEWGTKYSSFDVVPHYTLKEAKEKNLYPAWFAHRQYMEKMYAAVNHFLSKEIKKYDPDAKVGAEGSIPGDLEQTIKGLEFWGPYSDLVMDEVLRSIGGNRVRMLWWGGYTGSHGGRNEYPFPLWKDLLTGNVNGSAWFSSNIGSTGAPIGVDMDYAGYMKKMLPYMQRMKNGLAQLLNVTPLENDGIAILWNHTSDSARLLDPKFISPRDSISTFIRFGYHYGLNFDFLTSSMLDKLNDYKVLLLFGASAISDVESVAIKNFVKNGGVVIADLNPGIINENIKILENNPLPELFGNITYKNIGVPVTVPLTLNVDYKGKQLILKAEKVNTTSGIKPFTVRHYGKGDAILLNFTLSSAGVTCSKDASLATFMLDLLSTVNVKPPIIVAGINTRNAIIRVRKGNNFSVVGLLTSKADIGKNITISLPDTSYVYIPGEGYLLHGSNVTVKLDSPFKLFAYFTKKQNAPVIRLSNTSATPGEPVDLDLSGFMPGTVLFLQISNPAGELLTLREKVIIVSEYKKKYSLYFTFNDIPGTYSIMLSDIATGLNSEKKVVINQ